MPMLRLFVAVVLLLGSSQAPTAPQADEGCKPTASELKAWMKEARAANSDDSKFLSALHARVQGSLRLLFPAIDASMSPAINVIVWPRFVAYRAGLSEALRKMEPIDAVPIPPGFVVQVDPQQIDAPDIIKIVLQRDGVSVAPLSRKLEPQTLKTRMGAERVIHAGNILFPCSAFAPGANVTITAIPESGDNIVRRLTSEDLSFMR